MSRSKLGLSKASAPWRTATSPPADEVLAAWGEAYWFLADVLIARDAQLYAEKTERESGAAA